MWFLSLFLLLIGSAVDSLDLHNVQIPPFKLVGEDVEMHCRFTLALGEQLYAVKWYKDFSEIYRYIPRFNPSIFVHFVEGVNIDKKRSDAQKITLRAVDIRASGHYRCEISAEAPFFASVYGEGFLQTLYLPKSEDQPQLRIAKGIYGVGEFLDLNCTAPRSFPPAKLSFYINEFLVKESFRGRGEGFPHESEDVLPPPSPESSSLGLRVKLSEAHFDPDGRVRVLCISQVSAFPWDGSSGSQMASDSVGSNHYSHHNYNNRYRLKAHHLHQENSAIGNPIVFDTREAFITLVRSSSASFLKPEIILFLIIKSILLYIVF